ncbi:MAG: hypothetical protein ABIN36_11165 [Ferruginibacter sp.]
MKYSFSKIIIFLGFIILIYSCSKDSGSSDSLAANTGTTTGQGGSLARFTISGDYLYAVTNNSLYAYDIGDPANPVQTYMQDIGFSVETIYPYGDKLFIGTTTGLFIYSIATPSSPVRIGEATHARSCDPVVANDSIAFVTLKGNSNCGPAISGLYVHDIRNVLSPQLINTIPISSPEGLGLKESTLYVCCNTGGLKVFNVSNPVHPAEIRTITGAYFKDVIPFGDLLICYVSDGIMLYDISDPTNPVQVKMITNS